MARKSHLKELVTLTLRMAIMEAGSHPMQLLFQVTCHLDFHLLIGCLSEQSPPHSFFTTHTEEIQHEDIGVGELVEEVIRDVNTKNMSPSWYQPANYRSTNMVKQNTGPQVCLSILLQTLCSNYKNKTNYQKIDIMWD